MEDLLIRYDSEPYVFGRDLHEVLNVPDPYEDWFYDLDGFKEGRDYQEEEYGDHRLTIGMAQEICHRRYEKELAKRLNAVERCWQNTPRIMRRELAHASDTIDALFGDCAILRQKIYELSPKRTYYDVVLDCEEPVSTETIAEDYGITVRQLNETLARKGILHRIGETYVPISAYRGNGYTICRHKVKWLQKGRLLIYDSLKAAGILPIIEK